MSGNTCTITAPIKATSYFRITLQVTGNLKVLFTFISIFNFRTIQHFYPLPEMRRTDLGSSGEDLNPAETICPDTDDYRSSNQLLLT